MSENTVVEQTPTASDVQETKLEGANIPQSPKKKAANASIDAQNALNGQKLAAREKIADMLREQRGVPQPVEQAETRNTETVAQKTTVAQVEKQAQSEQQFDYDKISARLKTEVAENLKLKQEAEAALAQARREKQELQESLQTPLQFIEKAGYTPDEWQAMLLSGGKDSVEMKKAKQAEMRAKQAEEAAMRAQNDLKQFKLDQLKQQAIDNEIKPALAANPIASKLVTPDQLLGMIQEHYRKTGEQLDPKVAAKTLEDTYTAQFEQLLADEKVAQKVQKKSTNTVVKREAAEVGPKTISNKLSSSTSPKNKLDSIQDRRNAALAILKNAGWVK